MQLFVAFDIDSRDVVFMYSNIPENVTLRRSGTIQQQNNAVIEFYTWMMARQWIYIIAYRSLEVTRFNTNRQIMRDFM